MRMLFLVLTAFIVATFSDMANARDRAPQRCGTDPCTVLQKGKVRGRIPVACVSIPFQKRGYGQVALFVLRGFRPPQNPEDLQRQLDGAIWKDSKVTGPIDDFCRNPKYFARGTTIVLCDEEHFGWITGASLRYAIRNGRPPNGQRVHIGTGV